MPRSAPHCNLCHKVKTTWREDCETNKRQRATHECSGVRCTNEKECGWEQGHIAERRQERADKKKEREQAKSEQKAKKQNTSSETHFREHSLFKAVMAKHEGQASPALLQNLIKTTRDVEREMIQTPVGARTAKELVAVFGALQRLPASPSTPTIRVEEILSPVIKMPSDLLAFKHQEALRIESATSSCLFVKHKPAPLIVEIPSPEEELMAELEAKKREADTLQKKIEAIHAKRRIVHDPTTLNF